jgi:hypothetical protein
MKVDSTVIEKNLSIVSEYYRLYYDEKGKDRAYSGGSTGFIPFKITMTLDGISGFKIYQKLQVNTGFLPNGYPTTSEFIVTGINNKLKDNDWETDLTVILIPKFEEFDSIMTTDLYSYVKHTPTVAPIIIDPAKPNQYGGLRGDLFAWVPGPNYPDPSDPNNYNGTKYSYSAHPEFVESRRQDLLVFQSSGYIVAILKSNESTIKSRTENWIQKPASNPPTIKESKSGGAVRYNTIDFTQPEQTQMYKDILTRLGAPATEYNLMWMKVWRAAEGAAATYNPWNSIQTKSNSTKYNASPGVKNYFSYQDGLDATIATLTNGNYPTILKALIKGLSSYDELKELAALTQLWDMTGKIPDKWK